MSNNGCNVYVLHLYRGKWCVDGCHSEDTDLTETFQILERMGGSPIYLKLVLEYREYYDDFMPRITDVTAEAKASVSKPPQYDTELAGYVDAMLGIESE